MCVTNTTYRLAQPVTFSNSQVLLKASLPQPVLPSTVSSSSSSLSSSSSVLSTIQARPKRRRAPQKPGRTAKNQERHFVVHNYHDHAYEELVSSSSPGGSSCKPRRGGLAGSFPVKLHTVLSQVEADGYASIISWQPHGRCFVIHQPQEFVELIMPRYFRQSKLTSFQRQLNLYGFQRLTRGKDAGGYYNEFFLRGKPNLCKSMTRTKVKGTRFKAASNPEMEPNFYAMPPVVPEACEIPRHPPVCVSPPLLEPLPVQCVAAQPPPMMTTTNSCWPMETDLHSVSNPPSVEGSAASSAKIPEQIIDEIFLNEDADNLDTLAEFCFDWDPSVVEPAFELQCQQDASLNYMLDRLLQD